jgi:hypothetical protein
MTRVSAEGGFGGAISAIFRDLGKTIGEGIREGVGGLKGMLFPGIPGDGKTSMNNAPLLHEAETTNELLSRIYREKGGMWA